MADNRGQLGNELNDQKISYGSPITSVPQELAFGCRVNRFYSSDIRKRLNEQKEAIETSISHLKVTQNWCL